jgi:rhodanese-related sulfurtransferase
MLEVIASSFAAAAVCDTGRLLVPSGADHVAQRSFLPDVWQLQVDTKIVCYCSSFSRTKFGT